MKHLFSILLIFFCTISHIKAQDLINNKELNITLGLVGNFTRYTIFEVDRSHWNPSAFELNFSTGMEYLIKPHKHFKIGPTIEIQNYKHRMKLVDPPNSTYSQHATQVRTGVTLIYNVKNAFEIYSNLAWLYVQNHANNNPKLIQNDQLSFITKNQNSLSANALSINFGLRKELKNAKQYFGSVSTIIGISSHAYADYSFEYMYNETPYNTFNCFDALRFSIQYSYNILRKEPKFKLNKTKMSKQKSRLDCPSF